MSNLANTAVIQRFRPHRLLSHPQIQSILASKSPRRHLWLRRGSLMEQVSQHHILDAGDGALLSGWHSRQPVGAPVSGLAVLIHGWEGSHDSVYLYSMACKLYGEGWNVFRLNLRDHGGTQHLNREMFNSARIGEVLGAIRAIQTLDVAQPLVVIGFSLGGNFALRVGLHGPEAGVTPRLSVGICPAINPDATMRAIDDGPLLFRYFFSDRWRQSLHAKSRAWPGHFDISRHLPVRGLVRATQLFVEDFTDFTDYESYVSTYTLTSEMLANAPSPLAVITAQDDPIIPYRDFAGLRAAGSVVAFDVTERGGHCGFIENFGMESWTERRVLELLRDIDRGT